MSFYSDEKNILIWLNIYHITNYKLIPNNEYGFIVDIYGNLNLSGMNLDSIPVKFNHISGYLDLADNNLKNLNAFKNGTCLELDVRYNYLTSLDGCPNTQGLICGYNKITSLYGCPQELKRFKCNNNFLKTLEFCPKKIEDVFDINDLPLESYLYIPDFVGGKIKINNKLLEYSDLYNLYLTDKSKNENKLLKKIIFEKDIVCNIINKI